MVNYVCPKCNKVFKQKCHYVNHTENKKYPCNKVEFIVPQNPTFFPQNPTNLIDILIKEPIINSNECICVYCEKTFARVDSLQRHLNGRCKSKGNYDELEKLKEDMKIIIQNYQKIENENANLKNEIDEIKIIQIG